MSQRYLGRSLFWSDAGAAATQLGQPRRLAVNSVEQRWHGHRHVSGPEGRSVGFVAAERDSWSFGCETAAPHKAGNAQIMHIIPYGFHYRLLPMLLIIRTIYIKI